MMKLLILDNYDSFTYNLVQFVEELLGREITIKRNDEIDIEDVEAFDTIILSPGPGLPKDAGVMPLILEKYSTTKRILGVCLGHQAIIETFGGKIRNLDAVYHGVATKILKTENESLILKDIPDKFYAGRYHSWAGVIEEFPKELLVTAVDEQNEIMALRHKSLDVFGVQFHPESIMTPYGKKMLANFLGLPYKLSKDELKRLGQSSNRTND